MRRPPRKKNAPIITKRLLLRVLFSASIIVIGTLFVYIYALSDDSHMSRREQTMVCVPNLFPLSSASAPSPRAPLSWRLRITVYDISDHMCFFTIAIISGQPGRDHLLTSIQSRPSHASCSWTLCPLFKTVVSDAPSSKTRCWWGRYRYLSLSSWGWYTCRSCRRFSIQPHYRCEICPFCLDLAQQARHYMNSGVSTSGRSTLTRPMRRSWRSWPSVLTISLRRFFRYLFTWGVGEIVIKFTFIGFLG